MSIAAEIIRMFKKIQVESVRLNGTERLAIMYRALNPFVKEPFLFDWDYMRKLGSTTKDYIVPSSMSFSKNGFELGNIHGSVTTINLIASELSDRILFDFLEEHQLLCVNLHVHPYDQLSAQKLIRNTLLNVKAMKANKQMAIIILTRRMGFLVPEVIFTIFPANCKNPLTNSKHS